ncbi:MAG TPA: MlaD family protein [Candidatus Dormibacteraeota bacterium]|jgi:phospholipid/cholesterol/gamma-HCH transport system substrate-binding protein|nr:MlaD family protein [Candidatus Dormibacteraeota bacterium]
MRSRWNLPITAAYLGFCAVVLFGIVAGIGITVPWQHPFQLTATFASGDGILAKNEVYIGGVKVGRVDDVQALAGQARVTMTIDDSHALPLYKDSTAEVRKKNLLNETYVELSRGSAASGEMGSGGRIPVAHTLTPVSIDEVLAILDPTTRDRLQLLLGGAGQALAARGTDLNAEADSTNRLVGSLNGPASVLDTRRQQLENVVVELQKLYDTLANQRDQVRDEFGTFNQVMGQLAAQEQQIGGTVQQADLLLQNLDTLVQGEAPNIQTVLRTLPGALANTAGFLSQSDRVLSGILPFRDQIHDVFPNLATSFADTDPSVTDALSPDGHQHLWSIYSVSCFTRCTSTGSSTAQSSAPAGGGAPNDMWAAAMGDTP